MKDFTVHDEGRIRWAWTVRWRGGRTYCRAETERDAKRIAEAMEGQHMTALSANLVAETPTNGPGTA